MSTQRKRTLPECAFWLACGLVLLVAWAPQGTWAQEPVGHDERDFARCDDCVFGIYDDPQRTERMGQVRTHAKEIFVGVDLSGESGFSSIEFSVEGLSSFHVAVEFLETPISVIGSIAAPERPDGAGGVRVAWADCLPAHVTIAKLTLTPKWDWPLNHVLRIGRKFPATSPFSAAPFFRQCEQTAGLHRTARSDIYILNPSVGVESHSWSTIKSLYGSHTTHD